MTVRPVRDDIRQALRGYQVENQFNKQINFIEQVGTHYPSLGFKPITDTKHLKDPARLYEFRINDQYRAYCIKPQPDVIEITSVDAHDRV